MKTAFNPLKTAKRFFPVIGVTPSGNGRSLVEESVYPEGDWICDAPPTKCGTFDIAAELVDRAEGFRRVAELNAKAIATGEREWWTLVEVGQLTKPADASFDLVDDSAGTLTVICEYQIRVVVPTYSELERYAIADNGNGNGATPAGNVVAA